MGNHVFHPEGLSKSLEASLAWVLATRFVKRRQQAQKPRDWASKWLLLHEAFTFQSVGAVVDVR